MGSVALHCFMSSTFSNSLWLKLKGDSNTLVLGNGNEVPMDGRIKVYVKIQQHQSQITCLVVELNDDIDMISSNNWLVQ